GWDDLAVHKKLSNAVEKASYVDTTLAPRWTVEPGDRGRPAPSRVAWQRNVRRYDLAAGLPGIETPVLLLCGRHDPQTPLQMAEQLHDLLPKARLVVFENSGHSPFVEEPRAFEQAVTEFLRPRPGPSAGAAAAWNR
ncbi:MAG: alpha/beta fold hydrolase, partial [Thermoleophilia bacterium]|nr:alpha/beta fold hydrolase [Thermoleophilia bacterium]